MKLVKLNLVFPATDGTSERSFSALKNVKTYLRPTTADNRLNHLMSFDVHKQETDGLDINAICEELVNCKDSWQALFGYYYNDVIHNARTTLNRRQFDVDITSICRKEKIDQCPHHFNVLFRRNFDERKIDVFFTKNVRELSDILVLTYFL